MEYCMAENVPFPINIFVFVGSPGKEINYEST